MLLTISTTHFPADDLSYLLHKHPSKTQSVDISAEELALREFSLGIEGLQRFADKKPLRIVHQCVFGVLALESEPVDPRL